MRSVLKLSIALSFLLLIGCAPITWVYQSGTALPVPLTKSVVILPPAANVSLRNAGGQLELRADWSSEVQSNITGAFQEYLFGKGVQFIPYENDVLLDEHVSALRQAVVIMDAVESGPIEGRVYSLGLESIDTFSSFEGDYLLISELNAEQASGGRQAVAILSAIAGIGVVTNTSSFRVALFDLRDGQLRWFNVDPQAQTDIGNVVDASPERWLEVTNHLMTDFPL